MGKSSTFADVNLTIRHIEWLLTLHDCVVIPRIGAVLAHNMPARVSDDGSMLLAPCRRYTFNTQITVGDGLLEQSVSRAKGIPYNVAYRLVNEDINTMLAQLQTTGQLSLGRIGTLISQGNDVISFEPFEDDVLTPLATWIGNTPAVVLGREARCESDVSATIIRPISRWQKIARGGVAAAALIAIAIVASTPITIDNANYASTALPKISGPQPAYIPSQDIPVLNLVVGDTEPIVVDTAKRNEWQNEHIEGFVIDCEEDASSSDSDVINKTNHEDAYFVVVASFATEKSAKQFIDDTRYKYNGELSILHQGSRYHIYADSAQEEATAYAILNNTVSKAFASAWVCRRK